MSPFVTGFPKSPRLKLSGSPWTTIPFCAGAIVIFFASFLFPFFISTCSPIPVFAFFLAIPSIRIISSPRSAGYAWSTIEYVSRSPLIEIMSPLSSSSFRISSGSILTTPLYASSCNASTTLSLIIFLSVFSLVVIFTYLFLVSLTAKPCGKSDRPLVDANFTI